MIKPLIRSHKYYPDSYNNSITYITLFQLCSKFQTLKEACTFLLDLQYNIFHQIHKPNLYNVKMNEEKMSNIEKHNQTTCL